MRGMKNVGDVHKLKGSDTLDVLELGDVSKLEGRDTLDTLKGEVLELDEVEQSSPLGTGDAVRCALPKIRAPHVLILHADVPMVRPELLRRLSEKKEDLIVSIIDGRPKPLELVKPSYGRVILEGNVPVDIVESKNATPEQLDINTYNAAIYMASRECLNKCVQCIKKNEVTGEFYFTDVVRIAHKKGFSSECAEVSEYEAAGIDTLDDATNFPLQRVLRNRMPGVTFQDASSVVLSMDTRIEPGTTVGAFNVFGTGVDIGANVTIHPFCVLEDCKIDAGCVIGPFAHIRGGARARENAVIGNFVEVKKSTIGAGSKAKHLSYIGDATLGDNVNVGAGAVFCNYDGKRKNPTRVCDGASIGANTSLVAPLVVGGDAYIGAGSVITKDVPDATLALARAPQVHDATWVKKRRKRL
jgi:bifunctional UDP-N-acetylglucosamine pyrophosphorylase/glucosamine-1-phosphate N-acetyltransferase